MRQIGSFNHYELATSSGDLPMPLFRAAREDVYLAVDRLHRQLVELHFASPQAEGASAACIVLPPGSGQGADPVLETGEVHGERYYMTAFKDGELLERYVARRGALIAPTAFSLVLHLLDELLELSRVRGNLKGVSLERVMVCLEDDSLLRLRILDYGRCTLPDEPELDEVPRLVREVSQVLGRLLTGPVRTGVHPDRVAVLNTLPGRLRNSLRACMGVPGESAATLEALRLQVQEAFLAQSRDLHGKDTRRHMVALENMVPHSSLRDQLFPDPPNMEVLARRYQLEDVGGERHPFSLPVTEAATNRKLTVQLLPRPGTLASLAPACLAPQLGDLREESHPNVLRCAGAWEGGPLAFLLEDRAHDLPLLHVLRERGILKPLEVRLLLAQLKQAVDQAGSAGLADLDLRPGNLVLRVTARVSDREVDKLVHRHLDAWPSFLVLTRAHATLRCLMEPPLERKAAGGALNTDLARDFAALAVVLFRGERSVGAGAGRSDDALSPELKGLVERLHQALKDGGVLPSPADLLGSIEALVPLPVYAGDGEDSGWDDSGPGHRLAPRASLRERLRGQHPADEPMESMGSVSDFDEDLDPPAAGMEAAGEGASPGSGKPVLADFARKTFLRGLWALVLFASIATFLLVVLTAVWDLGRHRSGADELPVAQEALSTRVADEVAPAGD